MLSAALQHNWILLNMLRMYLCCNEMNYIVRFINPIISACHLGKDNFFCQVDGHPGSPFI